MLLQHTFIEVLKAVSCAMAKRDARNYLNAVNIFMGKKSMTITATTGHFLMSAEIELDHAVDRSLLKMQPETGFIISRDDIIQIKKIFQMKGQLWSRLSRVSITPDEGDDYKIKIILGNGILSIVLTPETAKYPDWKVAIPTVHDDDDGKYPSINGGYLKLVGAAIGALSNHDIVDMNSTHSQKPVTITMAKPKNDLDGLSSALGLIMPCRKP